jgi:hypothetical protein
MAMLESLVGLLPYLLVIITEKPEDVTVHNVDDTEPHAVESAEGVSTIKARHMGKGIPTSYSTRSNMGTNGRNPDRRHEIIWALTYDDEHSDADGEEGKFLGVAPLGTSDLDIRDWHATGGPRDTDYTSEEDELLEMASSQTADNVAKAAAFTLSQFSEVMSPDGLNGAQFTRYAISSHLSSLTLTFFG